MEHTRQGCNSNFPPDKFSTEPSRPQTTGVRLTFPDKRTSRWAVSTVETRTRQGCNSIFQPGTFLPWACQQHATGVRHQFPTRASVETASFISPSFFFLFSVFPLPTSRAFLLRSFRAFGLVHLFCVVDSPCVVRPDARRQVCRLNPESCFLPGSRSGALLAWIKRWLAFPESRTGLRESQQPTNCPTS